MNKVLLAVFLSLFSVLECLGENINPKLIAVYVVGDVNNGYKKVIYSSIVKAINDDNSFKIVERADEILSTVIDESGYQNSGSVEQNQIIQLGRQAGAAYIFAVDVSDILGELYATSRIINAEEALVLATNDTSKKIIDMQSLKSFASEIATKTIAELPENKAKLKKEEERRLREQQVQAKKRDAIEYLKKVKLYGPFNTAYSLRQFRCPGGYRIAKLNDLRKIQQANRTLGEQNYNYVVYNISETTNTYYQNSKRKYPLRHEIKYYYLFANGNMWNDEKSFIEDKSGNIIKDNSLIDPVYIYCISGY